MPNQWRQVAPAICRLRFAQWTLPGKKRLRGGGISCRIGHWWTNFPHPFSAGDFDVRRSSTEG